MSVDASEDWYAKNLADLRLKPNASEADVSAALVRPVLEGVLGFGILEIDAEPTTVAGQRGQRLRPDFICGKPGAPVARVIFEVKKLDADLQRRVDKAWSSAPAGQLHRYLLNHARAGTGTWGVLTNGTDWVVVQRGQGALKPWEFGVMQSASTLKDVRALLAGVTRSKPPTTMRSRRQEGAVDWLDALASCESPQAFLARVAPAASLASAAGAAFAKIAEHPTAGEMLATPTHLACLEIDLPDGHLAPQDISERLRGIPGLVGRVVGVAYTRTREGSRAGRAFLRDGHSLLSTALVEPELPGSRAADQFAALAVHAWDASPVAMRDALSSVPLHREFHEEIAEWFSSGLRGLDERQRGNRLRHLIRVMFAWLLQVRGVLPDDALWLPTREPRGKFTVHQHLTWLFTNVLAKPKGERTGQKDPWRQLLVQDAPFLNGSLFSELQPRERVERIENDAYLGNGGLLSILSSYAWTLSDRTGYESESAVDPSMLGELFERLMIEVEGKREEGSNLKMPGGTYYTPQDVADEMAADAIAGRLCTEMTNIDWHDARTVVHPSPKTDAWNAWAPATKVNVMRLLNATTVFDPCCGSGVFTLAMLHALWRAKGRLSREKLSADDLEDIIERQLYAVDVHPTAVLITRLRLFIALVDARTRHGQSQQAVKPLPNLETRCMAANTLCVDPKGQASVMGPEWNKGIGNLRAAREAWTRAHYPDEKQFALSEERTARDQLHAIGEQWIAPHDLMWLDANFLSPSAPAAEFDVRRLFPAPEGGWDIVIGNPPYQKPDRPDKARAKRLGYTDTSANLYLMFIEAVLEVAKAPGCVTLVVPHSIVFRRHGAFKETRELIERVAEDVDIRTYDNRPRAAFPNLPWLKGEDKANDNRQRVTVLTIRTRASPRSIPRTVVRSSGLIRLSASNRMEAIRKVRRGHPQPPPSLQWTQAATTELSDLLDAMRDTTLLEVTPSGRTRTLTFPSTAMYFISCLPEGRGDDDRRTRSAVIADHFWPWIGLYNSHLFHAYWLMVGDAFHVTRYDFGTVRHPPGWADESLRRETEKVARRLTHTQVLQACRQDHVGAGGKLFPNFNFHLDHTPGPSIIRELDGLLLDAYGLPRDPLMDQMRTIRTSSAHLL